MNNPVYEAGLTSAMGPLRWRASFCRSDCISLKFATCELDGLFFMHIVYRVPGRINLVMQLIIPTKANIRTLNRRIGSKSILAGYVSRQPSEDMLLAGGGVSNDLRVLAENPSWKRQNNVGLNHQWAIHNKFKDQELIATMIESGMAKGPGGVVVTYTFKSFDPSGDPVYHEDNNRTFTRCIDIKVNMNMQPANEIYKIMGLDATDKFDATVPIQTFLKYNYQSLRENGIAPMGDPREHNPILYQRGGNYGDFNYHGYLACQIFPTNGDVIKPHSQDMVYRVESFTDNDHELMYLERRYMWKLSMSVAVDDGSAVAEELKADPRNDNVMERLFGRQGVITELNQGEDMQVSQFASDVVIDEEAMKIVHKPVQVKNEDVLPSEDPKFYPEYQHNGGW